MGIDYKKKYLKYKNKYLEAKKIYGGSREDVIEYRGEAPPSPEVGDFWGLFGIATADAPAATSLKEVPASIDEKELSLDELKEIDQMLVRLEEISKLKIESDGLKTLLTSLKKKLLKCENKADMDAVNKVMPKEEDDEDDEDGVEV